MGVSVASMSCAASVPVAASTTPAADSASSPARSAKPLYDRLGGTPAITAVVDELLLRVGRDGRINAQFANADMKRLRDMLIDQICEATGGPCRYHGKDMKTTHIGMRITGDDFTALMTDLGDALVALKVPATERQQLLGALAPMKTDIVEQPGRAESASPGAPARTRESAVVATRARMFREAAGLLDKAESAREKPDRSSAELLFSSAELIVGPTALAELGPIFREGAPPRIDTPLTSFPKDSPAQPRISGNSDDDATAEPPKRGSLAGHLLLPGQLPLTGLAVVGLEPASGKFRPRRPRQRVMEQRNREFAPRVLVVPVGSTVSFPNFDSVFHNVFSRTGIYPFDLGIYRTGEARELTFDKEGIVKIACNLHANMSAYLVVVSSPHYAVANEQGRFSFASVEPGRYRLRVWTERGDVPVVQNVEIKAGANLATVVIPVSGAANAPGVSVSVDKFGAPRVVAARP
jgi:hemoglobin